MQSLHILRENLLQNCSLEFYSKDINHFMFEQHCCSGSPYFKNLWICFCSLFLNVFVIFIKIFLLQSSKSSSLKEIKSVA